MRTLVQSKTKDFYMPFAAAKSRNAPVMSVHKYFFMWLLMSLSVRLSSRNGSDFSVKHGEHNLGTATAPKQKLRKYHESLEEL